MSSDSATVAEQTADQRGSVPRILDLVFGFFVWAIHFLIVYCANALACARGIGTASGTMQSAFKAGLVLVTLLALGVVALHAVRAWRARGRRQPFLANLTIGCDALGGVGIAMQLFPLLMLHLCR